VTVLERRSLFSYAVSYSIRTKRSDSNVAPAAIKPPPTPTIIIMKIKAITRPSTLAESAANGLFITRFELFFG
jgi:hypothetical protein